MASIASGPEVPLAERLSQGLHAAKTDLQVGSNWLEAVRQDSDGARLALSWPRRRAAKPARLWTIHPATS